VLNNSEKLHRKSSRFLPTKIDASSVIERADAARDRGQLALAAELYSQVPESSQSYPDALVQQGNMLKDLGNYLYARECYARASTLTNRADLHLQQGHLAKLMGELDAALQHYENAAALGSGPSKDEICGFGALDLTKSVFPVQRRILPASSGVCLERAVAPYLEAGLLDSNYYRKRYFANKTDYEIWDEFLRAGAFNGRSYSDKLDSMAYLQSNPDIAETEQNPVMHWHHFGQTEGRGIQERFRNYSLIPPYTAIPHSSGAISGDCPKIAVHIHLYYKDFIPKISRSLSTFPFDYTLLIAHSSSIREDDLDFFRFLPGVTKLVTKRVANRGRNFGPLLVEFSSEVLAHDLLCHIHSKKSLYSGREQVGWCSYLVDNLVGDPHLVRQHVRQFVSNPNLSLLSAVPFWKVAYWGSHWLKNEAVGNNLCRRLGLPSAEGFLCYPLGGMFWCRPSGLHRLFEENWSYNDFPPEEGQTDGTMQHAIERVVGLLASETGQSALYYEPWTNKYAVCYDVLAGYRQYSSETYFNMMKQRKLACFDVFDTIVYRESLDKQIGKRAVAERIKELGYSLLADQFIKSRDEIELELRKELSFAGDIRLDEVYERLVAEKRIPENSASELYQLEFESDFKDLRPREVVVTLVNKLVNHGTRVAFVSDIYYSKTQVRRILNMVGVSRRVDLFVSSEMRARKDTGKIWKGVSRENGVALQDIFHVGDNLVSDVQMLSDAGIPYGLIINIMDKAGYILGIDLSKKDQLERIIAKGGKRLIIAAGRDPFFNSESEIVGIDDSDFQKLEDYAILSLGPLLNTYFSQLVRRCEKEGRTHIGFISREGVFLQKAFELFCGARNIKIRSVHIPASRVFLTKLLLDKTGTEVLEKMSFQGPISRLISDKLAIDETAWVDCPDAVAWLNTEIDLPKDTDQLRAIWSKVSDLVAPRISEKRRAYKKYLEKLGVGRATLLADVGYSGSLQSLLSWIMEIPLDGHYIISTSEQKKLRPEYTGSLHALFPNAGLFNRGNPLLDHSLILEIMMSANHGQLDDAHPTSDDEIAFIYGPKGRAQFVFPIFQTLQTAVIEYLSETSNVDLQLLTDEEHTVWLRKFIKRLLGLPRMAPRVLVRHSDADDRINGLGFVNPWDCIPTMARA
jgi:FMN phosphatase YigB (HAD superfamily)/tetratricopeptide (TPR) repeat protein